MKADIKHLQDTFKMGYEMYESSRREAREIVDMYHNAHYTQTELSTLANRGQPAETFNIIKMYTRHLVGYFSTIINSIKATPRTQKDVSTSAIITDILDYIQYTNDFERVSERLQIDAILQGLSCVYLDVEEQLDSSGEVRVDDFGRKLYDIKMNHVPAEEIVIDPYAKLDDYSDARFIHRFKWVSEEEVDSLFGVAKRKKLDADDNHLEIDEADINFNYEGDFNGKFKHFDSYLVVHSIIRDKDETYSMFWSGDTILEKKKISYKTVKFPYLVVKTNDSSKAEYYGLYRDVVETQKAINQAIIQIQMLANTDKVLVQKGAVEDIDAFNIDFNRVNSVIQVNNINGIKVENMSGVVVEQYRIIDNALDRIQQVLNINPAFLGQSAASDSGRKVKMNQNATQVGLRYLTSKIEYMYKTIGINTVGLITQYYRASQALRLTDPFVGERWLEINQPTLIPTGRTYPNGQPELDIGYEEALDPETGKPLEDELGNIIVVPMSDSETDITANESNIEIESLAYNDTDDVDRMFLEQVVQGNSGQFLMNSNPSAYAQLIAMSSKQLNSRYSSEIADLFMQTAQMLQPQAPLADPRLVGQQGQGGGQPNGAGAMISAMGASNDQAPAGYNLPKGN